MLCAMRALVVIATVVQMALVACTEVDPNGYVVFCPCMGRFGNQLDYFLGSLAFAESLNRTLVLASFIQYVPFAATSTQVPFDAYFKVEAVNKHHRAVTMETFMRHVAPSVWPPDKRISFCYQRRSSYVVQSSSDKNAASHKDACAASFGNPSAPFWQHYNVQFVDSELHAPLLYDTAGVSSQAADWRRRYRPHQWPVLAFAGSPASYPARPHAAMLRGHFVWSDSVVSRSRQLQRRLTAAPYVAVHLRIGSDWERACELLEPAEDSNAAATVNLFSSAQCLGYHGEHGALSMSLCLPSPAAVARTVSRAVRHVAATAVYVACDDVSRVHQYTNLLKQESYQVVTGDGYDPQAELALMARANLFVGNCVSSFSAVVSGERRHHRLPTWFFNFNQPSHSDNAHTEL